MYGKYSDYYPWITVIQIDNYVVKRNNKIRYLGVIGDECLSFKNYISFTFSKIARNIGMMRKLKNIFPNYLMILIY